MSKRVKQATEFLFVCIPIIFLLILFATRSYSTHAFVDVEKVSTVKEHLITGDVYVVCLNGVKYYYIEDGISKLGIAPVYGTDGQIMLCRRR